MNAKLAIFWKLFLFKLFYFYLLDFGFECLCLIFISNDIIILYPEENNCLVWEIKCGNRIFLTLVDGYTYDFATSVLSLLWKADIPQNLLRPLHPHRTVVSIFLLIGHNDYLHNWPWLWLSQWRSIPVTCSAFPSTTLNKWPANYSCSC